MKVIDPGHDYEIDHYDTDPSDLGFAPLVFMKREGEAYPGNIGHHAGTNCQELLRVLIDRVKYVESQLSDPNNPQILNGLRVCLYLFEERAAALHELRGELLDVVSNAGGMGSIESIPFCRICGHIVCKGH